MFVFEGTLAHTPLPKIESRLLNRRRWDQALSLWRLNQHAGQLLLNTQRLGQPTDVLTFHPPAFAKRLDDWFSLQGVPVNDVMCGEYDYWSMELSMDRSIQVVYDENPEHRFGYGYKARTLDG